MENQSGVVRVKGSGDDGANFNLSIKNAVSQQQKAELRLFRGTGIGQKQYAAFYRMAANGFPAPQLLPKLPARDPLRGKGFGNEIYPSEKDR